MGSGAGSQGDGHNLLIHNSREEELPGKVECDVGPAIC